EMTAEIDSFSPVYMARIAQLTNKSNQFNLTTKRYTQAEIESTAADDNYVTLYGKLIDKFGDNGVVSITIGHVDGEACDIDLWLMSCRVLKRDMEYAMMDELVARLKARGVKTLRGHYLPTAKNKMVKNFYGDMGFTLVEEKEDGASDWTLDLDGYVNQNKHIKR
ncbi:MAG: HAD family hydrolase, partial [Pseudobutyrivibrio sp.]|nr:HAD family hydrolase [Pseudobutyrivibrio sp.]